MSRARREKRPITHVAFRHLQPRMVVAGHGILLTAPGIADLTRPREAYALLVGGRRLRAATFDQRFGVYSDSLPEGWAEPPDPSAEAVA